MKFILVMSILNLLALPVVAQGGERAIDFNNIEELRAALSESVGHQLTFIGPKNAALARAICFRVQGKGSRPVGTYFENGRRLVACIPPVEEALKNVKANETICKSLGFSFWRVDGPFLICSRVRKPSL